MQEGSGVTNLQTELNYLDSFKSYCNSCDLGFLGSWGVGQVGRGCLGWSAIVYMSWGMFRGKESSNRIELSRLVQDLLNFAILGSLRLWGWGAGWMGVVGGLGGWGWGVVGGAGWMGVGDGWGVPPTHVHMHAHACMVNMIIPCKSLPPLDLGKSQGYPMMSYVRVHACTCMCMCVGGPCHHPSPPSTQPPPPRVGDPRNQSKFNSTWTNRDISILFEDLKSVETSPPMGGCIISWVGGWVGGFMGGVRSNH